MSMANQVLSIAPFVEAVAAVVLITAGLSFFFTSKRVWHVMFWILLAVCGVGMWLHAVWALPK